MRVVLCDDDPYMRETLVAVVERTGHEVAGVADTTASALGLIQTGRPDAVILDLSLGYDSDFDLISAAYGVGAHVVVFSHYVDADLLQRYSIRPVVIAKPDLAALERVLQRLFAGTADLLAVEIDLRDGQPNRRRGPERVASGPVPTGVDDAQAFFEAVNDAQPGDGMLSLDVPWATDPHRVATEVARHVRGIDRVLVLSRSVRVYLPGGGGEAARSLLGRVVREEPALAEAPGAAIVVEAGESGPAAFDRLRHGTHSS